MNLNLRIKSYRTLTNDSRLPELSKMDFDRYNDSCLKKSGKKGELFEAGNIKELEKKIEELWEDDVKCREYAENCGQMQFDTAEGYCRKLLRIYRGERENGGEE